MINMTKLQDVNILYQTPVIQPLNLLESIRSTDEDKDFINKSRQEIIDILNKTDNRKIIITGPCSIHNIEVAKEYGNFIKESREQFGEKLLIIMRVYFEKPRTTIGWKGFINDPNLDNTYDTNKGLQLARELLLYLTSIKVPVACEFLDTFTPQYLSDLITWGAIGARTVESQVHRQLVSGLSMPVGFKNSTSGDIQVALDAVISSKSEHHFYGIDYSGQACNVHTRGNPNLHVILRGGSSGPNYKKDIVSNIDKTTNIIIDCSHGNSLKNHKNQSLVVNYIIENYIKSSSGDNEFSNVIGLMLESNINSGNQKITNKPLQYGVSITDACIDIKETKDLLYDLFNAM